MKSVWRCVFPLILCISLIFTSRLQKTWSPSTTMKWISCRWSLPWSSKAHYLLDSPLDDDQMSLKCSLQLESSTSDYFFNWNLITFNKNKACSSRSHHVINVWLETESNLKRIQPGAIRLIISLIANQKFVKFDANSAWSSRARYSNDS